MSRVALLRMHSLGVSAVLAFSVSALAFAAAMAQNPGAVIAIGGRVLHPQSLTLQDLQKLPSTHVQVSFATGHGTESGDYTGALLRTVLDNASPIDDPGKNARLRHTFLVSGRDGYAVALSQGEIDPDFEGKSVLLAYAKDGKPFDPVDGIRLIVPNDKHAGRAVRDVVAVEVR